MMPWDGSSSISRRGRVINERPKNRRGFRVNRNPVPHYKSKTPPSDPIKGPRIFAGTEREAGALAYLAIR